MSCTYNYYLFIFKKNKIQYISKTKFDINICYDIQNINHDIYL